MEDLSCLETARALMELACEGKREEHWRRERRSAHGLAHAVRLNQPGLNQSASLTTEGGVHCLRGLTCFKRKIRVLCVVQVSLWTAAACLDLFILVFNSFLLGHLEHLDTN